VYFSILQNIHANNMIDAAAAEGDEPVQMKVHKSLKLWSFYVDLEESLGTLDSTRVVYERILDLRIATPQIILNYAYLLEVRSFSKVSMF
jgi:pre-mRNA-splicing factor SYF1